MGREGGAPENKARGYKAAMKNPHVSQQAKQHAQDELNQIESSTAGGQERHEGNVKRGLKAATNNPNVTDYGKREARSKLEAMGEQVEEPSD
ncbi:hypothetical protein MPDQ_003955 [Monascus purpureus]|uniref:Conidiation-specific protein 6 n=1 Tax=Monascus purpureus TaxID=5098 RepID=A0A507QYC6_MONPU|nr:hypothetical protein MPDQ_003955 [Monascus purpureus]BDD63885.1 hypothetical protein MAP00_008742 [Monascus purpureus]